MFRELDPVLHSQVRLAVMSVLVGVKSASFNYLLDAVSTSKGNLSFQLRKLEEAGYIRIDKTFKNRFPLTTCSITPGGVRAMEKYLDSISSYFKTLNQKNRKP